ncbi:MAG: gliding motility-associated C-terminal domain-containing protein, partial [Bacteroidetes bacterium]|nr:gliding motility-associated C-terminal domain-containing protein [Bacteroidota bacterium]
NGGTPSYTYTWSNNQSGITATNLCDGTYYVTVYDSHNCTANDTITIEDPSLLIINTSASNVPCIEICNGVATALASGSAPPYTYQWSNGFAGNPATNLCAGTYTVTVTDSHFCTKEDIITVNDSTVFPPVINTFADDTVIFASRSTGLHTTVFSGLSYFWTPANSLNNSNSPNPIAAPTTTTTYYVTIVDIYGCSYLDSVTVYVIDVLCDESQIFIPNAFTPNGDNKNDKVFIRSNILNSIYFVIYNRWGEKVFETYDIGKGWNGTYKEKTCDPGVFDYYMKGICINNKEFIKKGNITLIR